MKGVEVEEFKDVEVYPDEELFVVVVRKNSKLRLDEDQLMEKLEPWTNQLQIRSEDGSSFSWTEGRSRAQVSDVHGFFGANESLAQALVDDVHGTGNEPASSMSSTSSSLRAQVIALVGRFSSALGSRSHMHGRTPHRLEVFKMGRCKDLPDGSESWVDEECRRRYEAMTQMIAPSSDIDAESHTLATPEDAFISVMGNDRPGRVRCAGSGETLGTWYRSTGTSASSERERIMQEQLKVQEEKLKAQEEEMTQMREKISRLENVAMKVDEMSILLSQIQASQAHTQHVPPAGQSGSDSETDEAAYDYSDHVSLFLSYFITLSRTFSTFLRAWVVAQ
ncbi:hypothetical protein Taro_045503 [Colocasia esculenta]|uniref:Uncharacterized protein n=1 Tax=Colocasia esculenta TaxID=4460 RepID=A0A843WX83_COLES|nr:hypothetical protein [Colocasia esculenta]